MRTPFIFAVALFSLAHIAPVSAEDAETYDGSYVRRPTLVVSDMDAALSLYRDILGFRLGSLKEDPKTSYVYEAFNIPNEATVMHATLDSDVEKRTLSLVEYKALLQKSSNEDVRMAAVLMNANGRFDEIESALRAGGYHLLSSHALGANGIEMGFLDRDGHLIVVYQINYRKETGQ